MADSFVSRFGCYTIIWDKTAHSSTVGFWGCQSPSVSCVFMVAPRGWFRSSSTGSYRVPAPVPAGPLRWSARPANSAMVS